MSKEKTVPEMVMEQEKEGVIVFMGIEGAMGAKISEFIQQPADGILYDLNRDKATLLSQYSKDNVRWINDYAVAVTITSLRAELERVKAENEWIPCETRLPKSLQPVFAKVKMNGKILITAAQYVAPKTVLSSDFLSEEFDTEGIEEYDESIDDYWVVEGWWENSIEADTNWNLSGEVIEWRPLPTAPEEGECKDCGGTGEVTWDYDDPELEATVKAKAPCPKCNKEQK